MTRLALFSCAWGLAMTASAGSNLYFQSQTFEPRTAMLLIFFFLGGFIAFPIAQTIMNFIPKHWESSQRFSAALITLLLFTIGMTALIFALHFRIYFSQWHDDTLSRRFLFETVFTLLSAIYQFFVLGLRLYLPIGFIALLGASWAFAFKRI